MSQPFTRISSYSKKNLLLNFLVINKLNLTNTLYETEGSRTLILSHMFYSLEYTFYWKTASRVLFPNLFNVNASTLLRIL